MKNIVCWNREATLRIVNPDVDAQPDAFFRAVHTDSPIRQMDERRNNTKIVTADNVLDDFLQAPNFALVPVIGDSGSGKSHLIRWLNLRIKRDASREVLFVPKAKTNLRDIVRALIDRIPSDGQEKYLDMLQGTGTGQLNVGAQRSSVLNNIQTELKNDPGDPQAEDGDLEEYLVKGLSDLFIDPYIRNEHFILDGSFAAELAAHVYERPEGYNPAERRREFSLEDLPLEVESLMKAAGGTREFLQYLVGQPVETRQRAVDVINRHTDAAIARCLNLSGDHLIQIMNEMRQNIKKDGKELILLIEDFARLQGLDRALLQSVLDQGNAEICTLRTAFACTTGFYGSLERTAQTRASFVIDMDNPLGQGKDAFNLHGMVARYMNAVRIGPEVLEKEWERERGREASFEIKSHCDECEHQTICHSAFGHEGGYGLYPFTRKAIDVMARRADDHVDERFNVRQFQKKVLKPVTEYTSAIEGGIFPPKALLNDLGGLRNFPMDEQQIVRRQAPDDAERHLTLIALWAGDTRAINVDKRIQEAFNIRPLDAGVVPPEAGSGDDESPAPSPKPEPFSREADELSRWANSDTKLTQQLANDLRPRVYEAVCSFINWDEIGCPKATWSGSNGVFRQNSVIFVRQSTKPVAGSLVSLEIPLNWDDDDNRTATFLALTGLIESQKAKSWGIPEANKKFVCLQECLQAWSDHVTKQMLELKQGPASWHPASAALELRALAVLLSTPQNKVPDNLDLVELGLAPLGEQAAFATSDLEKVFQLIAGKQEPLLRAIREGVSASKGGQAGSFINSSILIEAMKTFKGRNYSLTELPDDKELRVPFHKEIFTVSKAVRSQIDGAIQKEIDLRLNWLEHVERAFGNETDEKKISEVFRQTISEISSLGIPGSGDVQIKAVRFSESNYATAVRATRNIRKQQKIRPWDLASNVRGAMTTSNELISQALDVLGRAKGKIEALMESQGYDPAVRDELLEQMKEDLETICRALAGGANE